MASEVQDPSRPPAGIIAHREMHEAEGEMKDKAAEVLMTLLPIAERRKL